jgi:hypothetical protein
MITIPILKTGLNHLHFLKILIDLCTFQLFGGIIAARYRNLMDPFGAGAAGAAFSSGM